MTALFKLLRAQWLTRAEIADEMGVDDKTAAAWAGELEANGMLLSRAHPSWRKAGTAPAQFALAPEWGGQP